MTEPAAFALIVLLGVALIWVSVAFARYRLVYRFGEADVLAQRRDASKRSRSVVAGMTAEQLAPLLGEFGERFDPGDARFLGAPVDYVVFDGIASGKLRQVVLVEIKTGGSRLNANEREVQRAVREGRVGFEIMRLP